MIRVLGCSGSIAARCHTTAFLLDDDILIDAGSGVGELRLDELARIDHILLSHSHLDHVLSIPLLADSVMKLRQGPGGLTDLRPINVYGLPQTLDALRQHLFNGVIWPDFTRLPSAAHPILKGPNPALWQALQGRRIAQLVIETAFGNEEAHLAHISGHLSPQSLAKELEQLDGEVSVYITHPKPGEVPSVLAQIRALDTRHKIEPLREGQRFNGAVEPH
jgi:cAMP phosphodiesterase